MSFETFLPWLLVHEGGYVNHPKDPGGATNKGVTQRVYDGFRRRRGMGGQSVKHISDDEVAAIYRAQYFDAIRGDDLPAGLDYAMFDFAVNSGPSRAAKFLQRRLGVTADGVIGNQTLGAIEGESVADLIDGLCHDRLEWMKTLRTWKTFGRGWRRRVMGDHDGVQEDDTGVIDRAMRLHRKQVVRPPCEAPEHVKLGKALDQDRSNVAAASEAAQDVKNWAKMAGVLGTPAAAILSTVGDLPPAMQYGLMGIAGVVTVGIVARMIIREAR